MSPLHTPTISKQKQTKLNNIYEAGKVMAKHLVLLCFVTLIVAQETKAKSAIIGTGKFLE